MTTSRAYKFERLANVSDLCQRRLNLTSPNRKCPSNWFKAYRDVPEKLVFSTLRNAQDQREPVGILWEDDYALGAKLYANIARWKREKGAPEKAAKGLTPMDLYAEQRRFQEEASGVRHALVTPVHTDTFMPLFLNDGNPIIPKALNEAASLLSESAHFPRKHSNALLPGSVILGDHPLVSFRDIQEALTAYDLRRRGIPVDAISGKIYPHFGVFWPARQEYIDLVAVAAAERLDHSIKIGSVLDCGTGTGVLAILLAQRGCKRILATDIDARAVACARYNAETHKCEHVIEVVQSNVFPPSSAHETFSLMVCNPPWMPDNGPWSLSERGVYDENNVMISTFLQEARSKLTPSGQIWLLMSDFAQLIGLRPKAELERTFERNGLRVTKRYDTKAAHSKATRQFSKTDLLLNLRKMETVTLYVLQMT